MKLLTEVAETAVEVRTGRPTLGSIVSQLVAVAAVVYGIYAVIVPQPGLQPDWKPASGLAAIASFVTVLGAVFSSITLALRGTITRRGSL